MCVYIYIYIRKILYQGRGGQNAKHSLILHLSSLIILGSDWQLLHTPRIAAYSRQLLFNWKGVRRCFSEEPLSLADFWTSTPIAAGFL